jgi:hypothetical protein
LNFAASPDVNTGIDVDIAANDALGADAGTGADLHVIPDAAAWADLCLARSVIPTA